LFCDATSLWVGDLVLGLGDKSHEVVGKLDSINGVINKLSHIDDDLASFTANWSVTLNQTSLQERDKEGQGSGVNRLDKGGSTESIGAFWDLFWPGNAGNQGWDKWLNVSVAHGGGALDESISGGLLQLFLQVDHAIVESWDNLWERVGDLDWSSSSEGLKEVASTDLGLPFRLNVIHDLEEGWEDGADGVGVQGGNEGSTGLSGSAANSGVL